MTRLAIAALALCLAAPAVSYADSAPAAAAPADSLAPHTCKKPVVKTRMRKADDDSDYQEKVESYKTCINAYVAAQGELAKKHTDAANAAIQEYNEFVKEANARQDQ